MQIKNLRQKGVALLTLSLSLFALAAKAELGKVNDQFNTYAGDFKDYLSKTLENRITPLQPQTIKDIKEAAEERRDPIEARQKAEPLSDTEPKDGFENNSQIRSLLIGNEIDRQMTRGVVKGVLGKKEQILQDIDSLISQKDSYPSNIWKIDKDAQDDQATQDVVKHLVTMQAVQTLLVGETLSNAIQTRQDLQYSNLNLTNISQQLDEINRARRVDSAVEAARLFRMSAQTRLF